MSIETKVALDAAIAAHVASRVDGDILCDYVLVISSTSIADIGTGATTYFLETNAGQPAHVTLGLLALANRRSDMTENDRE